MHYGAAGHDSGRRDFGQCGVEWAAPCRCAAPSWRRALARALLAIGLALAAAACAPRFDWRDHRGADGLAATFPGHVQSATRGVELAGYRLEMRMDATRVDKLSFVIAVAPLPDASDATRSALVTAIEAGLLRNIDARAAGQRHQVTIARESGSAPLSALAFEADGHDQDGALHISARIFASGPYLYQVLVAGPSAAMGEPETKEAVDTFMTSLRPS